MENRTKNITETGERLVPSILPKSFQLVFQRAKGGITQLQDPATLRIRSNHCCHGLAGLQPVVSQQLLRPDLASTALNPFETPFETLPRVLVESQQRSNLHPWDDVIIMHHASHFELKLYDIRSTCSSPKTKL